MGLETHIVKGGTFHISSGDIKAFFSLTESFAVVLSSLILLFFVLLICF